MALYKAQDSLLDPWLHEDRHNHSFQDVQQRQVVPYNMDEKFYSVGKSFGTGYALFPGSVQWCPWQSQREANEVDFVGSKWFRENHQMDFRQYISLSRAEAMALYHSMLPIVTPLFFNVVSGQACWRIPRSRAKGSAQQMPSAMALLLCNFNPGWECLGLGIGPYEGELIIRGPLSESELLELGHGSFPKTLERYGLPGLGVCEESKQVAVIKFAATSVRTPKGPRAPVSTYHEFSIGNTASYGGRPRQPRKPSQLSVASHVPRKPRRYNVSLSSSSPSTDPEEELDPKGKQAKKSKAKGKAPRRLRSRSVESVMGKAGRLAISDGEPRRSKKPARKPTYPIAKSDDEAEARPSRRAATAKGPPRPTYSIPLPPPHPVPRRDSHPPSRHGEPSSSGRAGPLSEKVRHKELSVWAYDEPPKLDPAEQKFLDELKEANGFGKRKGKDP
ncbi:MAG: hypothetical protein Q9210_006546 [Variospora velana]